MKKIKIKRNPLRKKIWFFMIPVILGAAIITKSLSLEESHHTLENYENQISESSLTNYGEGIGVNLIYNEKIFQKFLFKYFPVILIFF